MKNLVAIIAGDPNSINSELIAKAWNRRNNFKKLNIFVIGNYSLLKSQLKKVKINLNLEKINSIEGKKFRKKLLIYDVKVKSKSVYLKNCFNLGVKLAKQKKILGFINCPINKKEMFGNNSYGITEFLAKKEGNLGKEVMLIYNEKLSVSPITTHIKLKKVSRDISKRKIINKLITINKFYSNKLKVKAKIGVLGLNPHNNELKNNSEEKKYIIPAIKKLKKLKMSIDGPISPDTAFLESNRKKFNVLIGMYHDQVLSPFKAIFGFNAINITLGIPYIRISPDHGVGRDIINKNLANPKSLIEAIKFFNNRNVKT